MIMGETFIDETDDEVFCVNALILLSFAMFSSSILDFWGADSVTFSFKAIEFERELVLYKAGYLLAKRWLEPPVGPVGDFLRGIAVITKD